ncbi:MAG: insulinase family protein [Alistipes sp.]|nr:insulinase family protein [Alistipes sp.]
MKRFLTLAVVVVAMLAAACSQYKYETVEGDPMGARIYTLDNGLKVYMAVNDETPRIQTYIAVRVGGKNDPAETTGLAHYFEHLMFKGTPSFGTSDYEAEKPLLDQIEQLFEVYRVTEDEAERKAIYHQIDSISYEASKIAIPNEYDKLMSAIGAEGTNAYTSQDVTCYVENIPSNQIENWARIEADRFMNPVIRGFHTELETIYEEKNMSLTRDARKVREAVDAVLFPNHPYGKQTVLGSQEHLKNPSITNVKNYHKTYYVPNNMAICLSGDFDPDQMIATIDKYFGQMQPNPELPTLQFEPEQPITSPIVKEVFGPEAENVTVAWRLGGSTSEDADLAAVASSILSNRQAGLVDLNINQQQKTLGVFAGESLQPDYGMMMMQGRPKQGQSLDQVRDLMLEQVDLLRRGEWDESLLEASINNLKAGMMQIMDSNEGRADLFVDAFVNGQEWADVVSEVDRLSKITKEQVVAWANEKLGAENYAIVYKRQGVDPNEQKIAKPAITPIVTNRDKQSAFLTEIQNSVVTPIEPRYVDFQQDMVALIPDVEGCPSEALDTLYEHAILYKKNETTETFRLVYLFEVGTNLDPKLGTAFSYLDYLGTATRSAEQIARELYQIACSYRFTAGSDRSYVTVSGLSEHMEQAMQILEDHLYHAVADEQVLAGLKNDMLKSRANAKHNQAANFSALRRYISYGGDFVDRTTLSNKELQALTSEDLLSCIEGLTHSQHRILYYGPKSVSEVRELLLRVHNTKSTHCFWNEIAPLQATPESRVVLAQYDAKQLYYYQFSNRGEQFDVKNDPEIRLYNEYFGGGMNAIVFQEMREARGLAYSAQAYMPMPSNKKLPYTYTAFIATQNDKMQQAIEAFDEIINRMPESEAAFEIAKKALLERIRTERVVKEQVLWEYLFAEDMGVMEDRNKAVYEAVQQMTLADVKAAQEKWVKDRTYIYGILGDIRDLDQNFLKTLGPIQKVSQEEIFGY